MNQVGQGAEALELDGGIVTVDGVVAKHDGSVSLHEFAVAGIASGFAGPSGQPVTVSAADGAQTLSVYPLLFALADVYPDPPVVIGLPTILPTAPSTLDGSVRGAVEVATGVGWTRPRVVVHVSDIAGIPDVGGRGRS